MSIKKYIIFFVVVSLGLMRCNSKTTLTAQQIVEKSIEFHGGLSKWKSIKTLSFDKKSTLFDANNQVESTVNQQQKFQFSPELSGTISWVAKGESNFIYYRNNTVSKTVNDSIITDLEVLKKAKKAFFASQYVIRQPFDLINKNITLTLLGTENVNKNEAFKIQVIYDGDTEKSDKWVYYFDTKTFKVIANKVILLDHASFVDNLTFDAESDFIFNAHRKSYRLDKNGKKTYLRAEYYYSNFKITY